MRGSVLIECMLNICKYEATAAKKLLWQIKEVLL